MNLKPTLNDTLDSVAYIPLSGFIFFLIWN